MAGGLNKYTVVEAKNIGTGQTGNAFVQAATSATTYTPPSGSVIVAITLLSSTNFDELTPEDTSLWCGDTGSPGTNGTAFSEETMPSGITMYGRWLSFKLKAYTSGTKDRVLVYYAP